jgi:hypothetical protein
MRAGFWVVLDIPLYCRALLGGIQVYCGNLSFIPPLFSNRQGWQGFSFRTIGG